MTKKMMLLALAVVSAALFAMPAVASAGWGVDPEKQEFTGVNETGFVGNLSAAGEPKITCEGPSTTKGNWSNGTQGVFTLTATKCHASVIFTIQCKTLGAPASNTIVTSGSFKNVTLSPTENGTGFRGITVTPAHTTVECAGISSVTVTGSVIGRITEDPASCGAGVVDSTVTLEFLTKNGIQDPLKAVGESVSDDLSAQTGSGELKTAALEDKQHLSTASPTTWTCNAP